MIIYGINPVLEAIKSGRAKEIWVAQRADDRLQRLLEDAGKHSVRIRYVTRDELDHAAKKGAHQGVVADVERRTESTLEDLAGGKNGTPLIVVLDEVEDPQNVGAILRTVDACGGTGVVRQTRRAASLDGAAAKASAGAVNYVPIDGKSVSGSRQLRADCGRCQHCPVARRAEKGRRMDGGPRRQVQNGLL